MKFLRLIIPCIFMLLNACATVDHAQKIYRTSPWSSSEPLSIPYDVRLDHFEKGNLVANPSFEEGIPMNDNPGNAHRIKGWEIVGHNVGWTDLRSENGDREEVRSGRHAIKITRKRAHEIDQPEGIISDFIEVIPGNYYFSYQIRLENIKSNKFRLGVQLFDAVVIKVLYFDNAKLPIAPGRINPVNQSLIDNSDKGYSFSNFWSIEKFPWAQVRGRSFNYPFSEGDIPDDTRYIRLFLGLKGTGTMWVDDIDYRYSKWNFTPLERLKPYIARALPLEERLLPTPKNFQKINDIHFYDSAEPLSRLPVIVLPQNPAPADVTAANILQEKISTVLNRSMPAKEFKRSSIRIMKADCALKDLLPAKLIFSIGINRVYEKVRPNLSLTAIRGNPQGYAIKTAQLGKSHIVFIYGLTPIANYYGAATAVQLFEEDTAVYHSATVADYPDFLGRSYVFKRWKNVDELQNDLDSVSRLSLYKLNKVYLGYNRANKNWYLPDDLYRKGIRDAGKLCRESGTMRLAIMVNPYAHLGFESSAELLSDQLRNLWTHGGPESLEVLKNQFRPALNAGAETIMLRADDFVPHTGTNRQNYSLYTAKDKKRFVSLQHAQAHVINHLKRWIDREYPGTRLEFCPPWYSNEHVDRSDGKAEYYFRDLNFQISRDVAIIWTGPTIRSLSIDMADLYRYRNLIGRWPMLWDNTLYARSHQKPGYGGYPAHYPGKVRLCNLFEPYDTHRPAEYAKYNDGRQVYINGAASSEVYKIKYATVADYFWNTADYNPELSLWKALTGIYGRPAAELLLQFNDAYYGIYDMCLRLKTSEAQPEYFKAADKFLDDMRYYLTSISAELSDHPRLLKELKWHLKKQEKRYAKTIEHVQKTTGQ